MRNDYFHVRVHTISRERERERERERDLWTGERVHCYVRTTVRGIDCVNVGSADAFTFCAPLCSLARPVPLILLLIFHPRKNRPPFALIPPPLSMHRANGYRIRYSRYPLFRSKVTSRRFINSEREPRLRAVDRYFSSHYRIRRCNLEKTCNVVYIWNLLD